MKHNVDPKKFTVYRLVTEDKRYVAIPNEYVPVIEESAKRHGGIGKVPADKTVRGIFLEERQKEMYSLPSDGAQQNDITINQLR